MDTEYTALADPEAPIKPQDQDLQRGWTLDQKTHLARSYTETQNIYPYTEEPQTQVKTLRFNPRDQYRNHYKPRLESIYKPNTSNTQTNAEDRNPKQKLKIPKIKT